jgi:hypothetical protein
VDVIRSDARDSKSRSTSADAGAGASSLPSSAAEASDSALQSAAGNQAVIQRKASGPAAADPGQTYAQATAGAGGELPHRGAMEQSFGADLSGVTAHTGKGTEMTAMGARAATDGSSVAFADASPGKELVAHEVAHVVQQRQAGGGGGVQKKSTVSSPGSAAEVEADSVAPAAARGERVSVSEAPSGGIHRDELPGAAGGGTPGGGSAGTPATGGTPAAGGTPSRGRHSGAGRGWRDPRAVTRRADRRGREER